MRHTRNRQGRGILWIALALLAPALAAHGQALIRFANLGPGVSAPFFDDRTNRLAGSNFLAALYVAVSPTGPFVNFGVAQPFQQGTSAGFWTPADVPLPGIGGFTAVRVQIRFWDRARVPAANFEDAEAMGADIGVAEIPQLQLNGDNIATPLIGLASASLIPTLTLSRGSPLSASDPGLTASSSQLRMLCDVLVGTNRWFRLTSPQDALAVLNTDFSSIDTVMSAFTGSIVDISGLTQIACNDDRAPNRTSSAITFSVHANTLYLICVAGKNNANGPIRLTYATGLALEIRRWFPWGDLEISWPADGSAYWLESSTQPWRADSWSAVPGAPGLEAGRWVMEIQAAGKNHSFRLRSQP